MLLLTILRSSLSSSRNRLWTRRARPAGRRSCPRPCTNPSAWRKSATPPVEPPSCRPYAPVGVQTGRHPVRRFAQSRMCRSATGAPASPCGISAGALDSPVRIYNPLSVRFAPPFFFFFSGLTVPRRTLPALTEFRHVVLLFGLLFLLSTSLVIWEWRFLDWA